MSPLAAVRGRLDDACRRFGRPVGSVSLLAVTKSVDPGDAEALWHAGQRDFGENRLESLRRKVEYFRNRGLEARWHFIGQLQRNKARAVLGLAQTIHSVDRLSLLETLERVSAEEERRPRIFLQVNLDPPRTNPAAPAPTTPRAGLLPEDVPAVWARGSTSPSLEMVGLMAMAPNPLATTHAPGPGEAPSAEPASIPRRAFARLAALGDTLGPISGSGERPQLSMGMSSDLEDAIAEGADWVRIGRALFVPTGATGGPGPATPARVKDPRNSPADPS